jgi:hypothetical protein
MGICCAAKCAVAVKALDAAEAALVVGGRAHPAILIRRRAGNPLVARPCRIAQAALL